jgi:hypothetical protein
MKKLASITNNQTPIIKRVHERSHLFGYFIFALCPLLFALPIAQAQTPTPTADPIQYVNNQLSNPGTYSSDNGVNGIPSTATSPIQTPAPAANNTQTNTQAIPLLSTTPSAPAANQTPIGPSQNTTPLGLAICTGARDPANPGDIRPICDFNYLLQEGRAIINWLFVIAIPIATVLFAYGGILYILGTPGNRKKARDIFTAAGIGFGIMLIAWVSVYTIVSWLTTGTNSSSNNPNGVTTFLGQ